MKIYLVHPISGLSYDEVVDYYLGTMALLREYGHEVLMPMTGKGELRTEVKFKADFNYNPVSTNHAIMGRDNWMVHQSDIVYANLSGSTAVSIGSMMELAWAYELRKHVIVSMEKDNIHRHAFVLEAAHTVFESHDQAMKYLEKLSAQGL